MNITTLAGLVNEAASAYRIGALQQLRAKLHGKRATTKGIFHNRTIFPRTDGGYAFHDGGLKELQFNIGVETIDGVRCWRHGVAFSFKKGRNLPDPKVLRSRVRCFNNWIRAHVDALHGFTMWYWDKEGTTRSQLRSPGEILNDELADFIANGKFVFLGKMVPEPQVDIHQILRDFDRLYDLYEYVETEATRTAKAPPEITPKRDVSSVTHTIMSRLAAEIEVDRRHVLLQQLLVPILESEFPGCLVEPERPVAGGGRVDVAVDAGDGTLFCEIKVAPHVRGAA